MVVSNLQAVVVVEKLNCSSIDPGVLSLVNLLIFFNISFKSLSKAAKLRFCDSRFTDIFLKSLPKFT